MIQVYENLWVGNSKDGENAEVDCVLNVARDLRIERGWPEVEYMQVGLVDGPGNASAAYHSAILALAVMMDTHKRVLVHCHEGKSRSVSIALMYLTLLNDFDWNKQLATMRERVDAFIPEPHIAHRLAFDNINWKLLREVVG